MRYVKPNRAHWVIPILAAIAAGNGLQIVSAQPRTPTKAATAKAPRPRSQTRDGILSQASSTAVTVKAKEGDMTANLVPTTTYWRLETGLSPADLKVGDTVKFALRGTGGMATVQSLSPLTLQFEDAATLTLQKTSRMKFDRTSRLTAADLKSGQTTKVAANVFPDGKIEAREVWVTVKPVKAPSPAT